MVRPDVTGSQTPMKNWGPLMTRRGWLIRGESAVASTGLSLAVILLAAMAASGWWTMRTQREAALADRQAQAQTIEQQLSRLQAYAQEQRWSLDDAHIFRDDGFSGASLNRPGLDDLRDRASMADFDVVIITAPDRLARRYISPCLSG